MKVFNCIKKSLTWIWKKYPEIFSIPAAIAIWIISVSVLRLFDHTAGVFDAGVFQIIIFSILQLFVYLSIAWLILGLLFGTVRSFLKNNMKESFYNLSHWKKIVISYGLYFFLVFCLVALSFTLS